MPANISHLTSLFENATEGIILTNGTGIIVLVNPAAEQMFGYKSGEIIGEAIEILIPENVKPNHHQLRKGFYHRPSNRVMGQGRDLYGKRKDNTNLPVEVSLSHYKREEELFVIAFIVDITNRKEIENNVIQQREELVKSSIEIRKLNTELETKVEERTLILKEALQKLELSQAELNETLEKEKQLNEIKSRFVSMASHEFRTPLSTVLSSASLLSRYTQSQDQDKREKHIDRIKSSVNQLNDILEEFLSLGKLEEGKVTGEVGEFDLYELLNETIEEMQILAKSDQIINLNFEGNKFVSSDRKLLKNILVNLISNSIKFSHLSGQIFVHATTRLSFFTIEVEDHGIGIPEADFAHLFTSFFRAGNVLNIEGTGLGLHIVKRYLDLIGGKTSIISKLGDGTKVTINIPNKKIPSS